MLPTFYVQFFCQYYFNKKIQTQTVSWEKQWVTISFKKAAQIMLVKADCFSMLATTVRWNGI